MSDEDDIDAEGGLAELLRRGEAERYWDEAKGEWMWHLTEKGLASATKLIKALELDASTIPQPAPVAACRLDVDECAEDHGGEACSAHDNAPSELFHAWRKVAGTASRWECVNGCGTHCNGMGEPYSGPRGSIWGGGVCDGETPGAAAPQLSVPAEPPVVCGYCGKSPAGTHWGYCNQGAAPPAGTAK